MGVATSGIGVGLLAYPSLIRYLYGVFGWQGAVLILGGITFNLMACAACYPDIPSFDTKPTDQSRVKTLFNFHMFKNTDYVLLCVNSMLACFGIGVVYVHLAAYAGSLGIDAHRSALLFSTIGISNSLGRLLYGALERIPRCTPLILYVGGFIVVGVATAMVPLYHNYIWLQIFAVIFGTLSSAIGCMLPLILVEFLGPSLMASSYGNLMLFEAVGQTLGGPVAGKR